MFAATRWCAVHNNLPFCSRPRPYHKFKCLILSISPILCVRYLTHALMDFNIFYTNKIMCRAKHSAILVQGQDHTWMSNVLYLVFYQNFVSALYFSHALMDFNNIMHMHKTHSHACTHTNFQLNIHLCLIQNVMDLFRSQAYRMLQLASRGLLYCLQYFLY